MLIVELGSHDIIIGRNFFDYFRILIDVHHRRLQWPLEFPPTKTYSRTVTTYSRDEIRPRQVQWQHQQDMFRRDRAITRDDKRRQDGVHIQALTISLANSIPKEVACTSTCTAACREAKSHDVQSEEPDRKLVPVLAAAPSLPDNTTACKSKVYGHTWERQTHAALEHMQKELRRPYDYQSPLPKVQKPPPAAPTPSKQTKTPPAFDIRMLTGNRFLLNLRQPGVEMFSITLDGLDRLIQDKTQE